MSCCSVPWLFYMAVLWLMALVAWLKLADADLTLLFKSKFGRSIATLRGKVIWITGASSGIGEYLAYELAKVGSRLVLSGTNLENLELVKNKCLEFGKDKGAEVLVLPFSISNFSSHSEQLQKVLDHFGKLDVLVNNAGRSQRANFEEITVEIDKEMFDCNVFGAISLTRCVVKYFKEKGVQGHVVVNSSTTGKLGAPFSATYTGSKHALQGYYESLRLEGVILGGLDVTIVCPGPVFSRVRERAYTATPGKGCNFFNVVRYCIGDYRMYSPSGVMFDIVFGLETGLNLMFDLKLLSVLQPSCNPNVQPKNPAYAVIVLDRFILWNTGTTILCHATSVAAAKFRIQYMRIEVNADQDEASLRTNYFIAAVVVYTCIALVKGLILCALHNYRNEYEASLRRDLETAADARLPLTLIAAPSLLVISVHRLVGDEPPRGPAASQRVLPGQVPRDSEHQAPLRVSVPEPGPSPTRRSAPDQRAVALLRLLRILAASRRLAREPQHTGREDNTPLANNRSPVPKAQIDHQPELKPQERGPRTPVSASVPSGLPMSRVPPATRLVRFESPTSTTVTPKPCVHHVVSPSPRVQRPSAQPSPKPEEAGIPVVGKHRPRPASSRR
ncbi:uncharacterized protein [Dermacentor albipictus]|uniref:uncharacterized protein isoform X1 n=1 Tax=Dermacentor albipictus TaxID=60249 RepID=UPI0031FD536F